MKIDDKLRVIIHKIKQGELLNFEAEAQIKQAFAEKYWLMPKYPNTYPDPLVMTGQEWYDRFEKELEKLSRVPNLWDKTGIQEAAKKASGL